MEKVSVIVTIYNSEEYLERCIDSIINQTYKNLEIILVDDGSTDLSYKIMQEFAKKDNRIKIYHKENGGLVSCWKFGLNKVTAPYLTMVDSDDWLLLDSIEKMMDKAVNYDVDMVVGRTITEKSVFTKSIEGLFNSNDSKIYSRVYNRRQNDYLSISRWCKIYKTAFYKKVLKYEYEYCGNLLEDMIFVAPLYFLANKIYLLDEPCYVYFSNPNSMSNSKYKKGEFKLYNDIFYYAVNNDKSNGKACVYDLCGCFLYIKVSLLLFSDLSRKEKIAELKEMMSLKYTRETINNYKHIGFEKTVLKILLKLKMYWLIVMLKGTR